MRIAAATLFLSVKSTMPDGEEALRAQCEYRGHQQIDEHGSDRGSGSLSDGAFEEFERILGPAWKDTAIIVATEFGRTARINGTTGTDHGTGTVTFLAGGAIKGGHVIADWPGLKPNQLYENRDLAPTADLRAIVKGVLADHLGLSGMVMANSVFPDSIGVKPLGGLIV